MTNGVAVHEASLILWNFAGLEVGKNFFGFLDTAFMTVFASPSHDVGAVVNVSSASSLFGSEFEVIVDLVHHVSDEPCEHFLFFLSIDTLRQEGQTIVDGREPGDVMLLSLDVSNDIDGFAVFDNTASGQVEKIINDLSAVLDVNVVVILLHQSFFDVLPILGIIVDAIEASLLRVENVILCWFLG